MSDTKIGELTYYKWAYLGAFAAFGINPGPSRLARWLESCLSG